jgi:hypothetical protein
MKQSSSWRHTEHPIDTGSPRVKRSALDGLAGNCFSASKTFLAYGAWTEHRPGFSIFSHLADRLQKASE